MARLHVPSCPGAICGRGGPGRRQPYMAGKGRIRGVIEALGEGRQRLESCFEIAPIFRRESFARWCFVGGRAFLKPGGCGTRRLLAAKWRSAASISREAKASLFHQKVTQAGSSVPRRERLLRVGGDDESRLKSQKLNWWRGVIGFRSDAKSQNYWAGQGRTTRRS